MLLDLSLSFSEKITIFSSVSSILYEVLRFLIPRLAFSSVGCNNLLMVSGCWNSVMVIGGGGGVGGVIRSASESAKPMMNCRGTEPFKISPALKHSL